ncbi:UNVERIFIED_CONTAM: hypothetical protein Slati_2470900 [Sesamum latifolium]|uniref:Uncharacterized protein n=1 Tax=Sesamum latifolium TaxID=2727402 RepID=A0AAW2WDT7_9LAMI
MERSTFKDLIAHKPGPCHQHQHLFLGFGTLRKDLGHLPSSAGGGFPQGPSPQ